MLPRELSQNQTVREGEFRPVSKVVHLRTDLSMAHTAVEQEGIAQSRAGARDSGSPGLPRCMSSSAANRYSSANATISIGLAVEPGYGLNSDSCTTIPQNSSTPET
jgi:hypothetical protein